MKREIKFKVWDKNKSQMSEPFELNNELDCYMGWLDGCELMQYTGLKDKNGVEIYEGDIVEDSSSRYKIIYHTDGFYLHNIYEPENILLQLRHCYLLNTVIGNIYENPELIK